MRVLFHCACAGVSPKSFILETHDSIVNLKSEELPQLGMRLYFDILQDFSVPSHGLFCQHRCYASCLYSRILIFYFFLLFTAKIVAILRVRVHTSLLPTFFYVTIPINTLLCRMRPVDRSDLSREANILASSALLPPPSATPSAIPSSSPSSTQAKPKPKQAPSRPDKKGAWTKGFLTTTQDKPVRGGASPKV